METNLDVKLTPKELNEVLKQRFGDALRADLEAAEQASERFRRFLRESVGKKVKHKPAKAKPTGPNRKARRALKAKEKNYGKQQAP